MPDPTCEHGVSLNRECFDCDAFYQDWASMDYDSFADTMAIDAAEQEHYTITNNSSNYCDHGISLDKECVGCAAMAVSEYMSSTADFNLLNTIGKIRESDFFIKEPWIVSDFYPLYSNLN